MMSLSRALPWVSLTVPLAACQAPSSSSKRPLAELSTATTTPADATAPAESDVLPAVALVEPRPAVEPTATELMRDVGSANGFTLRILARVNRPTENALVSGASLRHALGATYIGARGTTASEMAAAIALDADERKAATLARAELAAWQEARGNAELNIATRLWVDAGFPLCADFSKAAEAAFGAAPTSVEYGKPEDARKTINTWVSEKTQAKIPELLPQGSIDPRTRLVVTNAIWFKGRWEAPFPKDATREEPFKTGLAGGARDKTASMMHVTERFRFAAPPGSSVKILEMRYAESQLAMLVALPDDPRGLGALESSLSAGAFESWTQSLASTRVNVTLPRFTFRSGGPMSGPLEDLGMKIAFTDKADFSGIVERRDGQAEPLSISQVFHQTWVAVDELGTEAAAATGIVMRTTSVEVGPVAEFRADHPFLFFVYDTKRGRILFAGRLLDPKA